MRGWLSRALHHHFVPGIAGLVTAVVIFWAWGSLRANPIIHDEASYLLQAKIFAAGRWTMPPPPLPEFFEQFHVLVTPAVASKYPAGHALLLAPGVLLGLPGTVPVILDALTGALIFLLARRVSDSATAAVTWFFWLTAPDTLRFAPSYFSETSSLALILVAWWALLRFRETQSLGALLATGAAVGWAAISRPLTALAAALPIGIFLLRGIGNADGVRSWRWLAIPVLSGAVILTILPFQNWRTTGDWRVSPYELYNRLYAPHDALGFRADLTPSVRALPPDLQDFSSTLLEFHRQQTFPALPGTIARRLGALARNVWGGWRWPLAILAVVGLFGMAREGLFALGTAALIFGAYLLHAHDPLWTLYYYEGEPALAFASAVGCIIVVRWLRRQFPSRVIAAALGALMTAIAVFGSMDAFQSRSVLALHASEQRSFLARVVRLPGKAIVFIRYPPGVFVGHSLIFNDPDFDRTRIWFAYDRGSDDQRLERAAPDRRPYLWDNGRHRFLPL